MYNSVYMRINISLSDEVATTLRKYAPERGVSRFLSEAALEKIERIKRDKALKALINAPPTFTNIPDGASYVRALRRESEKRSRRLGI